uniref:Uncharacterized protein n=1 Tax=Arundo donax TaxID=35708 RepID=A0A0A9GV09_ARUDO
MPPGPPKVYFGTLMPSLVCKRPLPLFWPGIFQSISR